jgi:hypothetical protein
LINLNRKPRKAIGTKNGLKIYSKLKTTTKIKPISEKQTKKNKNWKQITDGRCVEENNICQWCKLPGKRDGGFNGLTGHHIIKRRYGNHTAANCYIAHWATCHQFIEEHNIDVSIYKNKTEWDKAHADNPI